MFKKLGKLFNRKKTYSKDSSFKICIIDENAELLVDTLGITRERAKELTRTAVDALKNHKKKTDSFQQMLDECVHINEVIFSIDIFNAIIDDQKNKSIEHMILGKLFGNE